MPNLWCELGPLVLLEASVTGAAVGFIAGVFGIGGNFLLVPVLNIVLRIPMELAVGASVCQVLGPATTSLLARRISFRHLRLPLTLAGGLFVGVFAGARLLQAAKEFGQVSLPGRDASLTELIVLGTYCLLMLCLGSFALWEVYRTHRSQAVSRGRLLQWHIAPYGYFPEFQKAKLPVSIPVLAFFGLVVGFFAGLLGVSGGLLLLSGLIYLFGMNTRRAIATSLVVVWIVAAQATIVHAWHDNVRLPLVIALLVGGTIGARLGSEVSERLHSVQLRRSLGWLLLATALLTGGRLICLLWA